MNMFPLVSAGVRAAGLQVIARMSAVAYVLSGICKDILLVSLGAAVWGEVVTGQQVRNAAPLFVAVCLRGHARCLACLFYQPRAWRNRML
jgi:hypothetical protein